MSMIDSTVSRWVKGIEYTTMSKLLADFRKQLERDLDGRIEQTELNSALLLHDLCTFLKLGEKQRREVLGERGAAFVDSILATSVNATVRH
jgi:hypothetical protein